MNNYFKRKTKVIRIPRRNYNFKSNQILNQPTLISCLLNLMANQKAVIAIIRVKGKSDSEQSVPISFKLDKVQIPDDVRPNELHVKNLIEIYIPGHKPIPAMLAAIEGKSTPIF